METSIRWLTHFGIEQGHFSASQCQQALDTLGPGASLPAFARRLLESGAVTDPTVLENLIHQAHTHEAEGPPPNPFGAIEPVNGHAAALVAMPAAPLPAADPPTSDEPFSFERIASLDDQTLEAATRELLRSVAAMGASDLHLCTDARPFFRKHREIQYLSDHVLTADEAFRLNSVLLSDGQRQTYLERRDYDYALALSGSERYRVNLMFHRGGAAGAYRIIAAETQTLGQLGFEKHIETLHKLLSYHNGLILITGPVGSGKTTTLASMVAHLNETRSDHIITVEDPIEVVQPPKNCNVTQREVGPHTKSFSAALKGALREDPDVIVIGELRDLETIEMAISASETGHLVIGTMHTSDAATTLNRILDVFAPGQQAQIRTSVAESLRGIVCQRLLPAIDGGLALACEILVSNTAVQNLIREGKTQAVRNTMETGGRDGMCLMDSIVFNLWQAKRISADTARANITNKVIRARIS